MSSSLQQILSLLFPRRCPACGEMIRAAAPQLCEKCAAKPDTLMNRTYFSITDEGRDTLSYFGNRIGDAIRHDIDAYLDEKHLELQSEASITADYYKSTSGEYEAQLIAREKDVELVNIKLSVPTAEMAVSICDSWQKKNQKIYQYLMSELF